MSFDWQQDHTARVESYHDEDSYSFQNTNSTSTSPSSSADADKECASTFTSMQRTAQSHSDKNRMKKFEWKKDDVAKAHEASGVTSILFTACGRFLVSSGNDRRVRLWSTNNGCLHSINYDVSCTSSLPFAMEIVSDFSSGADDVLAHPSGDQGDVALVALHSPSGKPFKHLKGHLGAVTCIAYRRGHGQLITAAKDGMVYIWDSSASQKERESRVDYNRQRDKGRRDAGAVASHNDDSWSDGGDISDNEQSAPPRYFVPPIVQRYLEDAAESKKQLHQEQQRAAAARATTRTPSIPGTGMLVQSTDLGDGVRGVGGIRTTPGPNLNTAQYGSNSKYDYQVGSNATGLARVNADVRRGMKVKYKIKVKDKEKDKSMRERAETIFALAAASALRNTATSLSSTTSSSSSTNCSGVSSSMHVSGPSSFGSSTHALQGNGNTAAVNCSHDKPLVSLCQREKQREEKEKKVTRGKKEKSKLSSLREKYSVPSKKPRR